MPLTKGAQIAIKGVMMAAQVGLTMMNKIEGPRLDNLEVTTADYGTPLERFWGIRRLEGRPIFWAERIREKKKTSKGKSGKYKEYSYYGTFAIAVADHEIDKISRIWMDKHLVYDMTSAGPISVMSGFFVGLQGSPVKLTQGRNMRIYLGTEDQEPDPRMVAWCEDRYGPDSCPAYRGVAYIVFQDIPLEKFGNRIPQITVEAVNDSNINYLWDSETVDSGSDLIVFSADRTRFYADGWVWDAASVSRMYDVVEAPDVMGAGGDFYVLLDGLGTGGGPFLRHYHNDGQYRTVATAPNPADGILATLDGADIFIALRPFAAVSNVLQIYNGNDFTTVDLGFSATWLENDSEGNIWAAGREDGETEIQLACIKGPRNGDAHSFATGSIATVRLFINGDDEFVLEQNGNLHRLASDFTLLQTGSLTNAGTFTHIPNSDQLWRVVSSGVFEYDLTDLSEVRSEAETLWIGAPGDMEDGRYSPISHSVVSIGGGSLVHRFLDRVGSDGTLLANVVEDVADWCGVEEVDVSDLDQTVAGYSVTQGTGKDILSPLLDIHDVDARPHDFGIQFLKRGNSAIGTIPVTEFVREGDEPRYRLTIIQDTDLPATMFLNFADSDKDQQKNTVLPKRPANAVDSQRNLTIDLSTYVGTPPDMQKKADRYFRRKWNERHGIDNALTAEYLGIEPADVYNLELDDVTITAKVKKATLSQGRIALEWTKDFPALTNLGTGSGAAMEGRDDDEIYIPGPAKGFVLDIPITDDSHDLTVPQAHYAAGSYGSANFPGATIYQADEDENDYSPWNGIESADKAVWGYTTDALADAVSNNLWDRGNSVNVNINGGTLTTVTEADIDADPLTNLAALKAGDDWELLNFTTATLEANGSYTLSGFKRGRRGTEWAATGHIAGDEFVLVSSLARDGFGLSDVDTSMSFKAETLGRDYTFSPVIEVEFEGNTLMPYAPARAKLVYDGTDLQGTIIRRTRVGGDWTGGATIPVSETTEAYEVDVYNGATFKRTISVSGTNTFTYTAAMASADGITLPTPPTLVIHQLSDAVGRGFALAA